MENKLCYLIKEKLKQHKRIDFEINRYNGFDVDIKIGKLRNKSCGDIYDLLETWLGFEDFSEYLSSRTISFDYKGWFELIDNEIIVQIQFYQKPYNDADFSEIEFNIDTDFIEKQLKIKQSKNKNTAPSLIVDFSTGRDFKIYFNEIYFNYRKKKMNPEQLILLENYLIKIVKANMPTVYLNDFSCKINWEIYSENGENSLHYSFVTSPIKISWDEIYT
jgi:hypothetical protein